MNTLLRLETFDRFPVSEASITTFTTFSIDGSLHTDFFDPDDAQLLKEKRADAASLERCEIVLLFRHQRKTDTSAVQICVSASAGGVRKNDRGPCAAAGNRERVWMLSKFSV